MCSVSENVEHAKLIQKIFSNTSYFRVYTLTDLAGAELGGALKNIYAIASGMLEGSGYGDNARAALIARALVEMRKLATAMGSGSTYGLTGGRLVVTTSSHHSRNFSRSKLAQVKPGRNNHSIPMKSKAFGLAWLLMKRLRNKVKTPIIDAVTV